MMHLIKYLFIGIMLLDLFDYFFEFMIYFDNYDVKKRDFILNKIKNKYYKSLIFKDIKNILIFNAIISILFDVVLSLYLHNHLFYLVVILRNVMVILSNYKVYKLEKVKKLENITYAYNNKIGCAINLIYAIYALYLLTI